MRPRMRVMAKIDGSRCATLAMAAALINLSRRECYYRAYSPPSQYRRLPQGIFIIGEEAHAASRGGAPGLEDTRPLNRDRAFQVLLRLRLRKDTLHDLETLDHPPERRETLPVRMARAAEIEAGLVAQTDEKRVVDRPRREARQRDCTLQKLEAGHRGGF